MIVSVCSGLTQAITYSALIGQMNRMPQIALFVPGTTKPRGL